MMSKFINVRLILNYILNRLKRAKAKLYLLRYEMLYPFYRKKFKPSVTHQAFSVSAKQIYGDNRTPGVSGYYRIYNEEDFLEASVLSHLPFFDELVLVHDRTVTDKTPEICQALANKYPDKIKYFVYEPEAFKLSRSDNIYRILPPNHPNSFINYYNFALSKTTKQVVAKVDADHIAIKPAFEKIIQDVKNMDFMRPAFYKLSGINLWPHNGEIYVDPTKLLGLRGDHGFHTMRPEKYYYRKALLYEDGIFFSQNRRKENAGIVWFHLKNMRRNIAYQSNRGFSDEVHLKNRHRTTLEVQKNWVNWADFTSQYRNIFLQKTDTDIVELPDPNVYLQGLINSLKDN